MVGISGIDWKKRIQQQSPTDQTPQLYSSNDFKQIANLLNQILDRMQSKTNVHYFKSINTGSTTKTKIDFIQEMGFPMTELVVLDKGGGFDIQINSETDTITPATNFTINNEIISHIYVIGSGTAGTAQVRVGAWI